MVSSASVILRWCLHTQELNYFFLPSGPHSDIVSLAYD